MYRITLDAEAGQVSTELARHGITAATRVHVLVEVVGGIKEEVPDTVPMATLAQAGGAFDWLAEEPELYSDADLLPSPPRAG